LSFAIRAAHPNGATTENHQRRRLLVPFIFFAAHLLLQDLHRDTLLCIMATSGKHSFSNGRKVDARMIAKIPGLAELLDPDEARDGIEVSGCTAGCGFAEVFGKPFWVDFARKVIQHDTRNTPCSAPGQGSSGQTGGSVQTYSKPMVSHPRVNVNTVLPHLGATLGVPKTTFLKDERLNRHLGDGKRSALLDFHETQPDTFRNHVTRVTIMIAETQAALGMGKAACRSAAPSATRARRARSASAAAAAAGAGAASTDAAPDDIIAKIPVKVMLRDKHATSELAKKEVTFDILELNEVALAIMLRGINEYINWCTYVAWSGTYGPKVKAQLLIREIHESLLPDLATVMDAIVNGSAISTGLDALWDSCVFFVLGTLIFKNDDAGMAAFYRLERASRFDAICSKKFAWKPIEPASPSAGTAAAPSPERDAGGDEDSPAVGRKRTRDSDAGTGSNGEKGAGGAKGKRRRKGAAEQIRKLQQQLKEVRKGDGNGGKGAKS
jgi:hypothetical protein